ncbi:MAG: Rieske (2Fe-2S) protein [Planctomycetales bacterium]|nr:Rieske (2Fe-2S) protein [Planctomycetales bacterium]
MADKEKLSIEQILAAARNKDGGGAGAAPASEAGPAETPKPAAKAAAPAKPGKMSVADMLAAARSSDAGGEAAESAPAAPAEAKTAAPAKKPGQMSVAEMLAAARGDKSGGAAAAKPAPAKKPAAAKAAPAAKEPVAAKHTGPKDTTSILAAARAGATKPGPITKAEAAARAKEAGADPTKKKSAAPPMPTKPDYAKVAAPAASSSERRGFMVAATAIFAGTFFMTSSLAIGFSSLAVTMLLWVLGFARFMFPNILTEPPTKFKVGFPDEYAPGQVATKFKAQFGVWVVRYEYNGQPEIYALQSVCTHLGCTPNWLEGEQKFKCPCHGSGFYKDGINFEGPAPRPLERFAIRVADDGQLEVDKSRKFKEEVGQWKDPASYVSV